MEKIIDKEFKDNINEVMALKLHYIQRLFAEVCRQGMSILYCSGGG